MQISKDQPNIRHKDDDRKRIAAAAGVILLVVAVLLYTRIPERAPEKDGGPAVAATIFPLYEIVRNVAAGEIDVKLVLPPSASPHTFEPTPQSVAGLRNVKVVYAIGHGSDAWAEGLARDTDAGILVVDGGIALRESGEDEEHEEEDEDHEEEDEDHGHEGTDPHYWLNVLNAMTIARTVSVDLQARFPESADETERRTQEYLSRLRELHTELSATIGGAEEKRIVTLHDAWYYFADAYGLEIIGTFEPTAGREPTPRYLAELQVAIDAAGTTRLFSEPQIATASLDPFARDNGLTIATLDPIGGVPGRESYEELMRYNARVIAGE